MFAARQTPAQAGDALARLTWQDFEHLLAEHYRSQGYRVEHHAPVTSLKALAAGVDLRLHRGSENVIVQCKHWDTEEVQLQDVNELLGNMLNEAASKGIFVTRGRYSSDAKALMRRQPRLQLIDGDILRVMLKLPDHLDISLPGAASAQPAKAGKREKQDKARGTSARRRSSGNASRVGPALLVVAIVALLGLFIWHSMSRRDDVATAAATEDATQSPSATPASAPMPVATPTTGLAPPVDSAAATPTTGTPPLSGASGIVSKHGSIDPPSAAREIAERERLREQSDDARSARKHEDGMKVLEQSTRELGSHE
jgi:hypothetical protein